LSPEYDLNPVRFADMILVAQLAKNSKSYRDGEKEGRDQKSREDLKRFFHATMPKLFTLQLKDKSFGDESRILRSTKLSLRFLPCNVESRFA